MIKADNPPLDAAAVTLSAGCLAHCVLLPIAASMLPVLGVAADAEWVHWAFVALAVPVSFFALRRAGGAPTLTWALRAAASAGVGLLVLAAFGWPEHEWETPLTIAGSLILASAHILNIVRRHPRAA